jgi:ribA/ribD-fused uncharacterized protein
MSDIYKSGTKIYKLLISQPVANPIKHPSSRDGGVILFYSKSKDIDDLGVGGNNWRKKLSNFHPADITVNGRKYSSVEHSFQAEKARMSNKPSYAIQFESHGDLSPLDAKKMSSKGAYTRNNITLDIPKWNKNRKKVMKAALLARWRSDVEFKNILQKLQEQDKYLLHFERGGAKSYWGGNISKSTGYMVGENILGKLMMEISS